MIRRKYLVEGLSTHESKNIIDKEYLINNCQDFGFNDSIRNLFADLRAMLKNSSKIKNEEEALYLLQSIRNTSNEISNKAQIIIDTSCR